jgi:hypothetical protein
MVISSIAITPHYRVLLALNNRHLSTVASTRQWKDDNIHDDRGRSEPTNPHGGLFLQVHLQQHECIAYLAAYDKIHCTVLQEI